ncbi:YgaP family membrane protein [Halanaeroarchaeum sulfurireducens]|uniref:Inner membrane protein YgaP-like transmembrane domain-containing protein n=1 Tax=Halanaeroarchaeum sulfurireducens TaxID=1604004 RepID=A0A0F7PBC0_9EURY|nr:hypothetical protein HLASF_0970 [Halanaeroarchaeum sulfurireducens]
MDKNVGRYDRLLRIGIGSVLLIVGILSFTGAIPTGSATAILAFQFIVILIGAILSVTGLLQTCPVYTALGTNTR